MKVLTVKNPWAYLIIYDYDFGPGLWSKDVENRTWETKYRGPLLIHASKNLDRNIPWDRLPSGVNWKEYNGHIIGRVHLVDCVKNAKSRWAEEGLWHWVLKYPKPCKPIPIKGSLGLWEYSGEIKEMVV